MRVTFLGTGSAMPTGDRFQTGILIESGDGCLLLDCGCGVLHGLAATAVGYEGIDGVLLTHHHLDHVSDLLPLLKARWLAGATEVPFTIAGPPGTPDLVEGLLSVHEYMRGRLELDLREVGPGRFSIDGFDVEAMETRHSMYCLAYRLSGDGRRSYEGGPPGNGSESDSSAIVSGDFTFSGDSEAFEDLAAFAGGSAVLAHDCSFPDDVDVSNHPTPSQLGAVLSGHEYGRVYLTHLYPHTDGRHDEMLSSVGERYDGHVQFAHDGMVVEV